MSNFVLLTVKNMKSRYTLLFLLLSFSGGFYLSGQAPESSAQDTTARTLESEFQTLLRISSNYKENGVRHEVIQESRLLGFKEEVFDSLRVLQKQKRLLALELNEKEASLEKAQATFKSMQSELDRLEIDKERIQFLGMNMTKTGYRALSGSIIFCLLGGLLFFMYKYRHSNYITQQARSAMEEMEHEFEQHRRWALEREQKLSRELLDERNKKRQTT